MNYRSDRDSKLEINLNKICIASRHFEIKQLLGQIDSQDISQGKMGNNEVSPYLKIGWQERVTLHYLVVPIETSTSSVIFSTLSFAMDKNVEPESQPQLSNGAHVTDFMCRERAHDVFSVSPSLFDVCCDLFSSLTHHQFDTMLYPFLSFSQH